MFILSTEIGLEIQQLSKDFRQDQEKSKHVNITCI